MPRPPVLAALLLLAAGCAPGRAGDADLAYVSDYYSFVGADAAGRVAFALDANRGRDGDAFQAEHFAALHDEAQGWVPLQGSGAYANTARLLEEAPDSPHFRITGAPADGVTITSDTNGLTLTTGPIAVRVSETEGDGARRLGSGRARLHWRGRRLAGRVIHEHLRREGWNRLARTYWGTWHDWQSFYLVAGDAVGTEAGDLYLASEAEGEGRRTRGFLVLDGRAATLGDARLVIEDSAQALGLYRWARCWSGGWSEPEPARFALAAPDRRSFGNWIIGGFAMSAVAGTLTFGARTVPVYGLAELIK